MDTGVYQIKNLIDGRLYIGSASTSIRKRWVNHINQLRTNKHGNRKLQNSFNTHGEDAFEFKILEFVLPAACVSKEQMYIDDFKPYYNICKTAGSRHGMTHTKETIEKLKEKCIDRVFTKETRSKISKSLLGNKRRLGIPHDEKTKKKMSVAGKGRPSHRKGKNLPEATKEKMRISLKKRIMLMPAKEKIIRYPTKQRTGESLEKIRQFNLKYLYSIRTPDNQVETSNNLVDYCKKNGLHSSSLGDTFKGVTSNGVMSDTHRGYKVIMRELIDKSKVLLSSLEEIRV